MKSRSFASLFLFACLVFLAGCRTDQELFAGAVYTGVPAIIGAIIGIFYVVKKIL